MSEAQCTLQGLSFEYEAGINCMTPGFCGRTGMPTVPPTPTPKPTVGATPAPTLDVPYGSCEWTCDSGGDQENYCYNRLTESNCTSTELEDALEDASGTGSCFNPEFVDSGSCADECGQCVFQTTCCEAEFLFGIGFACTDTATDVSGSADCAEWFGALPIGTVMYFASATCQQNGRCV
jgi:hypothetical protein